MIIFNKCSDDFASFVTGTGASPDRSDRILSRAVERATPRRKSTNCSKRKKKLTKKNIAFLKSLGLKVKKH